MVWCTSCRIMQRAECLIFDIENQWMWDPSCPCHRQWRRDTVTPLQAPLGFRIPGFGSGELFAKPKNRNGTWTLEPWNPETCRWVAKLGSFMVHERLLSFHFRSNLFGKLFLQIIPTGCARNLPRNQVEMRFSRQHLYKRWWFPNGYNIRIHGRHTVLWNSVWKD